ncbi:sulfatase-like hydrolase/transferase [Roseateles sp.]|uniref:sulfatase-like hydrolase/transferase n=1 Tax=Roseateles sp. TaxID=1971397 RepID=UPI0025F898ED|nr:sulfatase-like hydrolase/transferase [Roseateles sp.]MBV8033821.1 sulfatase-like hydrolase/transferase [Roseateles sp.]
MAALLRIATQAARYATLTLIALASAALGDSLLQSPSAVYVAFEPALFLRDGGALAILLALAAIAGGTLDQPDRPRWLAGATRALLLALLFVALFQILRRPLAAALSLGFALKAGLLLTCLVTAGWLVWRAEVASQWRVATASGLALVAMYLLQPGMPGYLARIAFGHLPALAPAPAPHSVEAGVRRTLVVILDEWDQEISAREGLFGTPSFHELLGQSFVATQAMPAGPSTLSSVPGMMTGRRFGPVDRGGAGYLVAANGTRFDAGASSLFSDLQARGHSYAVVGFYHDYCAVIPAPRRCHAEPVRFFPGWRTSLARAFKQQRDFDNPYTDFLRQWSGTYARLQEAALEVAQDPGNTVVWLHLNVPHPPIAVAGATPNTLVEDYRANLVEMTRLLSELRAAVLKAGPASAMVITSDHWLREKELWSAIYEQQRGPGAGRAGKTADQHVPFIVWFSDATSPATLDQPISTTAVRDLVPALVERRIQTPADVATFFRSRGGDPITPFRAASDSSGVH